MSIADDSQAVLMFKKELLAVFIRWENESDLDVFQMAEASVEVINEVCGEGSIEFEPDSEFLDQFTEDKDD